MRVYWRTKEREGGYERERYESGWMNSTEIACGLIDLRVSMRAGGDAEEKVYECARCPCSHSRVTHALTTGQPCTGIAENKAKGTTACRERAILG